MLFFYYLPFILQWYLDVPIMSGLHVVSSTQMHKWQFFPSPSEMSKSWQDFPPITLQQLKPIHANSSAAVKPELCVFLFLCGMAMQPLLLQWSAEQLMFPTLKAAGSQQSRQQRGSKDLQWLRNTPLSLSGAQLWRQDHRVPKLFI